MQRVAFLFAISICLPACDSGGPSKQEQAAEAKAEQDKKEQEETDAKIAQRKAEREAQAKLDAEAEEKRLAEFKRLCVVPDPPPKKVPSCSDVGDSHDAFVRRVGSSDDVGKWETERESAMAMTVVRCNQADSTKVAMCQQFAFDNAGVEMLGYEKDLMQRCIDAFGKGGGRPGVVPPKPGG